MSATKRGADSADSPIRVLHVDDEPSLAELTATFLERESDDITVEALTSATDALDRLAGSTYDCIVADYEMPEMNGIEFLEVVRANCPDLPFILYTGRGSEEVASDAISAGVTDYLQKETGKSQYTILHNRIRNAVEQYRAHVALRDSEQRLALLIEQSPIGVLEFDESHHIVGVNEVGEEILGYSEDELVGEYWECLVPETCLEQVSGVMTELRDASGGYHSINENVRGDGEHIVCEWHNRVITDDDGVVAIISMFQDVTERQHARAEQERYEAYLEGSTDIIAVLDEDGDIQYASPSVRRILGHEPDQLVGASGFDLVHPDDTTAAVATLLRVVTEPTAVSDLECRLQTADGDWRWFEIRGDNQLDDPRIGGILANCRDVTERRQYEETLQAINEAGREVLQAETETEVASVLVDAIVDVLGEPNNAVWMYEAGAEALRPVAASTNQEIDVDTVPTFEADNSLAWQAFATGSTRHYDDVSTVPDRYNPETAFRSEIIVPLGGHGVVVVGSTECGALTARDVSLVETLARYAVAALDQRHPERELETGTETR